MIEAPEPGLHATAEAIAKWAEIVGIRFEHDRLPAVAAYLAEIEVAVEALAHLDLHDATLPGSFDPSWGEPDR
jgi:hypothetical protein